MGLPLAVVPIASQPAKALYLRKLVLVRPDGHVAWRGDDLPADCRWLLDRVRGAGSAVAARLHVPAAGDAAATNNIPQKIDQQEAT